MVNTGPVITGVRLQQLFFFVCCMQPSDVEGLHKKCEDPVMSEEGKVFQAVSYEVSGLIKFLISAHFPSLLFILSQSFPLGQSLDGALDLHCLHLAHDTGPAKGFTWKREPQTSNPELGVVINRPTWTCWVANWEKRNISSRKNSNGTEMEVNPSECSEMSAMLTFHADSACDFDIVIVRHIFDADWY